MSRKQPGKVRIIGGRWRGRRLPVPSLPGLRPSGDRGRETLFNWLSPVLRGARCADLFAGSGVLGLEAASRGAARVTLVEKAAPAVRVLRECIALLSEDGEPEIELVHADALSWLESREADSLDVVFIDPPFGLGLEKKALHSLVETGCLREGGLAYVETASRDDGFQPGPEWQTIREKTVGEVRMRLIKRTAAV
jgi:16S rRNA (guanine966-N2)-methyltransferase